MMTQTYPFHTVPLPYAYEALEPYIDAETLHYHHDKHLSAYVDNLNKILKPHPEYHDWTLTRLLENLEELPEEIRQPVLNNAGGVYNHILYFRLMSPSDGQNPMETILRKAFGSLEAFIEKMTECAMTQFGSGYAWLVVNPEKSLEILNTPNQNNPVSNGNIPILAIDVWEHAYYLKYKNMRKNYVDNWFRLINWKMVYDLYLKAIH